MRDFNEYARSHNDIKMRSGEKIFAKQIDGIEGVDLIVDKEPIRGLVHNNINPTSEKEYRSLHVQNHVKIQRGSYVTYLGEEYLVTTDVDSHFVYKSCKMQKCNQTLKWKQHDKIYEVPCIMANDSYGVKVLSDNDYIRSQNIKAQITIQNNENTRQIIPDMRFIFNHSETDIYSVVDINKSLNTGLIVLTCEKVVYQREDDLENNIAFSEVLLETNNESGNTISGSPMVTYEIVGADSFVQQTVSKFSLNPPVSCKFYLQDFDAQNIAEIKSQTENGECEIFAKKCMSNTWFTLYVEDDDGQLLTEKKIKITKK